MSEWITGPLNDYEGKFEAVVRHCNEKLNMKDQIVKLKTGEDGYYFAEESGELSWNWDVIKWKPYDKSKKWDCPVKRKDKSR